MSEMPSSQNALDEWKEARAILSRFDGNLHELRKYGFTILAALMTLDALQKLSDIDVIVKIGLIGLTMAVLVTLRLLEEDYKKFQQAAALRAKILETTVLNIELTEMISVKYQKEKINSLITDLYLAFAFITLLIGMIIIPFGVYWGALFIVAGVGFYLVFKIPDYLPLVFERSDLYKKPEAVAASGGTNPQPCKEVLPKEDWTIDKMSCVSGDKVKITFTNLDDAATTVNQNIVLDERYKEEHPYAFFIRKEEDGTAGKPVYFEKKNTTINVPSFGNCSWIWDTKGVQENTIYRVWPRGWTVPLKRSIVVYESSESTKKKQTAEILEKILKTL